MKKVRKDNSSDPRCLEKRRSHAIWCPYRKPTQVDEERILRRPDECSLRNSAKKQVYLRYIPCPFACWVNGKKFKVMRTGFIKQPNNWSVIVLANFLLMRRTGYTMANVYSQ